MPDSSQEQKFGNVDLTNSKLVSVNAGRDAIVDSPGAQIIRQSYWSLFGDRTTTPGIDWDWAMRILKQQQPDIKKRLKDSLFGLAEVDAVEMESKRQEASPALGLEAKKTLTVNGTDAGTIDPQAPIIATYAREEIDGSLLILGTPGAGKTITLLKLAEQLVGEAIVQPQTVIPIIFELSTWRDGQEIEAWLIEQLYENYGGNRKRKIYEMWVERRVLLPLLDGLDELGMERQKACTEKVNEFAKNWKVVVCCRVKEFQQAGVNLSNLRGKVQLQPLSDRQIEQYLQQMEKSGLWEQIQSVPEMGRLLEPVIDEKNADYDEPGLLRVPLFISLAAQVYEQDKPLKGKADLFERYIDRQLSWDVREGDRRKELKKRDWAFKTVEQEPKPEVARRSLTWISRQLQSQNQVELLIEKTQPNCLTTQWKNVYIVVISLIFGVVYGLSYGLIFGLRGGIIFGLLGLLVNGAMAALSDIKPVEQYRFSNPDFFKFTDRQMQIPALIIATLGILSGMTFGMILEKIYGTIFALICGTFLGLIFTVVFWLAKVSKVDLENRTYPNQGIHKSIQTALTIFIFALTTTAFLHPIISRIPFDEPAQKVLMSLVFGLFWYAFCEYGGQACIQHLILRIILTRHYPVPWNLAQFLTYCHDRRLLQQIGGRYRFIHRELLEHFARI